MPETQNHLRPKEVHEQELPEVVFGALKQAKPAAQQSAHRQGANEETHTLTNTAQVSQAMLG